MSDVVRRLSGRGASRAGTRTAHRTRAALAALGALLPLWLAGCNQLEPAAPAQPITNPAELYLRLELNHSALNLATDATVPAANTVQLVATPYDGTNTPIAGAPAPTFRLIGNDTTKLKVTSDGLLQGLAPGKKIKVAAELVLGDVRHADTVVVNVNAVAPVPVLDTFSIQVLDVSTGQVLPDNTFWYMLSTFGNVITNVYAYYAGVAPLLLATIISPRMVDAGGQPLDASELVIDYRSLDSTVAFVNPDGTITAVSPGYVSIVASTFAYGVAKTDTMRYTVQPPFGNEQSLVRGAFVQPARMSIVAGGIAGWLSQTSQPMDVTFDDPTNVTAPPEAFCDFVQASFPPPPSVPPAPYCGAGNIAAFIGDSTTFASPDGTAAWRWRRFPVPGTYTYRSTTTGATGTLIVVEPTPPPP